MSYGYFLKGVPNNKEGYEFIEKLREYLNTDSYRIKLRGNGRRADVARSEGIHPRSYDQSIPIQKAEHWRVYLEKK